MQIVSVNPHCAWKSCWSIKSCCTSQVHKSRSISTHCQNWWAWERCLRDCGDKSLKQVSMAALSAATNRCHQTDRVSGDIYHPIYLTNTNERERCEGVRTCYKHERHSWANCMILHSQQAKHASPAKPIWDPSEHGHLERLLTSIGLSQTSPKLHLAS